MMSGIWLVSYVLLWLLVASQATLLFVLFRQLGLRSLNTIDGISRDGLPVGTDAPAVDGLPVNHLLGSASSKTLLVFASPECRPCQALMPVLDDFLDDLKDLLNAYVIVGAMSPADNETPLRARNAVIVRDENAALRFRVRVTPFAFVVGEGRVQAKGLVNRRAQLDDLWRAASDGKSPVNGGVSYVS